ncbi:MAG: hypothetical protein VX138_06125 [Bacteroidota bacterium]|nr:hypothetical protein [Bacteroidota bacterium]
MEKLIILLYLLILKSFFGQSLNCDYPKYPDGQVIYDFKSDDDLKYKSVGIKSIVKTKEGMKITTEKGTNSKIIFSCNLDLSCWSYLAFTLENNSNSKLRVNTSVYGENQNRKWTKPLTGIYWIKENEILEVNNLLLPDYSTRKTLYKQLHKDFPNMRGFPEGISFVNSFDLRSVTGFDIEFPTSEFEQIFTLKKVRAHKPSISPTYISDKEGFFPFIDQYGQYKYLDWRGKIKNDNQLKTQILIEDKDLLSNPSSKEWNKYGGFLKGSRHQGTGHFRVEKIDGKWWFLDPDGYLFWSNGVNSAGRFEIPTPIKNREHFFEFLPSRNDSIYRKYYKRNEFYFGYLILDKKYGSTVQKPYLKRSILRMKSWGLNTMGGWSSKEVSDLVENEKIPYTLSIGTMRYKVNDKLPDVFSDKWFRLVNNSIKNHSQKVKNDPFFVGFFVDNEMKWFKPNNFVVEMFKYESESVTKNKYISYLRSELNDIYNLNKLCGSDFSSWEQFENMATSNILFKLHKFNIDFYKKFCDTYFRVIKNAIDTHTPNKLYLGCRWHVHKEHRNKFNVEIAAKYVDVLSFNQYVDELDDFTIPSNKKIDKPFLISEFNFGSLDHGKFYPGLGQASNQRNRGEKYENFIRSALKSNNCVGAHWFMWANSTTAGRGYEGENANCGIISETDTPYYELIKFMRKINYNIYSYRTKK